MSAILDALAAEPGCELVRAGTLDDFLSRHPRALVFLTGDIVQRPEGLDVAVVVRQMLSKYAGRLAHVALCTGVEEQASLATRHCKP